MGWCSGTQIFDDVAAALLDKNKTKIQFKKFLKSYIQIGSRRKKMKAEMTSDTLINLIKALLEGVFDGKLSQQAFVESVGIAIKLFEEENKK